VSNPRVGSLAGRLSPRASSEEPVFRQRQRESFAKPSWVRKASPQSVEAELSGSIRRPVVAKLWCWSGVHPIAKLALSVRFKTGVLGTKRDRLPRLPHLWVDAGYQGRGKERAEKASGLSVEVVHRTPKPTPEKVARIWAEEWSKEGRERSIGRDCFRDGASRYCRGAGLWSVPPRGFPRIGG